LTQCPLIAIYQLPAYQVQLVYRNNTIQKTNIEQRPMADPILFVSVTLNQTVIAFVFTAAGIMSHRYLKIHGRKGRT
jgi:hypothetical protein